MVHPLRGSTTQVIRPSPSSKEYNTRWKRRARNLSSLHQEHSSRTFSLLRKPSQEEEHIGVNLLVTSPTEEHILERSKSSAVTDSQPYQYK